MAQASGAGGSTTVGSTPVRFGLGGALAVRPRAKSCLPSVSLRTVRFTRRDFVSTSRFRMTTFWPFNSVLGALTVRQSPARYFMNFMGKGRVPPSPSRMFARS